MEKHNRKTPPVQGPKNLSGTKWDRRAFLAMGATGAVGSLPLWNVATSQAAETEPPAVSQPPLPVVDARFPSRIADGVWVVPDKRIPLVPNIGVIEGSHSVLVIDCGLSPQSGHNVLNAARAIAGKRDLILTVTHAHPEHTFGAQAFKGQARIYYNQLQRDYLAGDGEKLLKGFRPLLSPDRVYLLDDVQVTLADEVYQGNHASLDLGDRKVEFWTLGIGHSPGDQVIHIPDQGITFSGDLIEERMFPIVPFFPPLIRAQDINVRIWQTALTKMMEQRPRIIVPGHGDLGGVEIALQVNNYLESTRKLVASAGADKTSEKVPRLESVVRRQHPTWERSEYIAPALSYFAQNYKA